MVTSYFPTSGVSPGNIYENLNIKLCENIYPSKEPDLSIIARQRGKQVEKEAPEMIS